MRAFADMQGEAGIAAVPVGEWLKPVGDGPVLVIRAEGDEVTERLDQLSELIGPHPAVTIVAPGASSALPFEPGRFERVICAFISTAVKIENEMLREIGRVLSGDGQLLIVDTLVPGTRLRGKKARRLRQAGDYVNAWMRLRNNQHARCLDRDSWVGRLAEAQWDVEQMASREHEQDFELWAGRFSPSTEDRIRLRAMLLQAPEKAYGFLTPVCTGDRIDFRLSEIFIVASSDPSKKKANTYE